VQAAEVDFAAVMARVRRVIDEGIAFYEHQVARDDGIDLFREPARFVDEHRIEAGDASIEFTNAVIATGARPRIPPLPGLEQAPFATSDDLLRRTQLPKHLVCLGAGAVSLEFGQAYRRFGAEATIIQRGPQIAALEDTELARLLTRYLEAEGVAVITGTAAEAVEAAGSEVTVRLADGRSVSGDLLLVGVGRVPNVDAHGLDEVGLQRRATGVVVDAELRTSLPHVYAIGDAIGGYMFTHVATYEAPIAVANMLDDAHQRPDYRVIPRAIFTDPELAGVGLSEQQAEAGGY
jgi:pyruvate/2-oxoglutarate dehydrogenase complex dihydrolipoamide dehydrogenase (E3) component